MVDYAMGIRNITGGGRNLAIGIDNKTPAGRAIAIGGGNEANGAYSIAIGEGNKANATCQVIISSTPYSCPTDTPNTAFLEQVRMFKPGSILTFTAPNGTLNTVTFDNDGQMLVNGAVFQGSVGGGVADGSITVAKLNSDVITQFSNSYNTAYISGSDLVLENSYTGAGEYLSLQEATYDVLQLKDNTNSGAVHELTVENGKLALDGAQISSSSAGGGTLIPATETNLGGVKVGEGLSVEADGELKVDVDNIFIGQTYYQYDPQIIGTYYPGIWMGAGNKANPTVTNYAFLYDAASKANLLNSEPDGNFQFRVNNVTAITLDKNRNVALKEGYAVTAREKLDVDGRVFLGNKSEPTTPVDGGVMYVEDGTLKFKGSNGTVTTIAPA